MSGVDLDDGGRRFEDWRELVEANLAGCSCPTVVVVLRRDATGRVVSGEYDHTDSACRAVVALAADAVERLTGDGHADPS